MNLESGKARGEKQAIGGREIITVGRTHVTGRGRIITIGKDAGHHWKGEDHHC